MKPLAYLLIVASLVLGVVVAPTAYMPRLDLPDDRLDGLTLNTSAGKVFVEDEMLEAIRQRPGKVAEAVGVLRERAGSRLVPAFLAGEPRDGLDLLETDADTKVLALLDDAGLGALIEFDDSPSDEARALVGSEPVGEGARYFIAVLGLTSAQLDTLGAEATVSNGFVAPLDLPRPLGVGGYPEDLVVLGLVQLPGETMGDLRVDPDTGARRIGRGGFVPLVRANDVLTAGLLHRLRAAGVERVRVKEFDIARWSHKWWFALAMIGLIGGAFMLRMESPAAATGPKATTVESEVSPERVVADIRAIVSDLRRDLPSMEDDDQRNDAIVERLGTVQADLVPAFVDARPRLVSRLGLGGYAELMDRFAAAERQVNRAWSAAADGVYEEAAECLETAERLWEIVAETLPYDADQAAALRSPNGADAG